MHNEYAEVDQLDSEGIVSEKAVRFRDNLTEDKRIACLWRDYIV